MSKKLYFEEFKEFLLKKDLRLTRERDAVLGEIIKQKGHFDLEDIFTSLRKKGSKASRASVYRTIPLLVECGIVEQVENIHSHAHYELSLGRDHHDHMLCTTCGLVIEFHNEALEALQDKVCKEHGFAGLTHTLEIKGLCKKCSKS